MLYEEPNEVTTEKYYQLVDKVTKKQLYVHRFEQADKMSNTGSILTMKTTTTVNTSPVCDKGVHEAYMTISGFDTIEAMFNTL